MHGYYCFTDYKKLLYQLYTTHYYLLSIYLNVNNFKIHRDDKYKSHYSAKLTN